MVYLKSMSIGARRFQKAAHSSPSIPPRPSDTAGAIPVGTAVYAVPVGSIYVSPTGSDATGNGSLASPYQTFARANTAVAAGGTIVLRAGVYHEGTTGQRSNSTGIQITKNNVTVQNYPGEAVWFDGSVPVTNWTAEGSNRWSTPWTVSFDHSPTYSWGVDDSSTPNWRFVNSNYPCAPWPEQVFVDGVQLQQVDSLGKVTPSTFFVTGTTNGTPGDNKYQFSPTKITIGINPTGHTIRITDLQIALSAAAATNGVTMRGFGIRRYGTSMPQSGAIIPGGTHCTLENIHIEDIATTGTIAANAFTTFRNCTALRCGIRGFAAYRADDLLCDGIRAEYCNYEHFNYAPDEGGMKMTKSQRPVVCNSVFSHNYGKGFWADETIYDLKFYHNDLKDNEHTGFMFEISGYATVVDNLIDGAGHSGIHIVSSDHVRVWNNTVINCAGNAITSTSRQVQFLQDDRRPDGSSPGMDSRQPASFYETLMTWQITDFEYYNNVIAEPKSGTNAVIAIENHDSAHLRVFSTFGPHMDGNVYHYPTSLPAKYLAPNSTTGSLANYTTLTQFRSLTSQETAGTEYTSSSPLLPDRSVNPSLYSALAANATSLPSDIANLTGRSSGSKHIGYWV